MRRIAAAAAILLAGCVTAPPRSASCQVSEPDRFIGQNGTGEMGATILKGTNSSLLRWAPPGVMLSMDFNPSRVTVRLAPDGRITAISCG